MHDLAYGTAVQTNIDNMIMCEPNKNVVEGSDWEKDKEWV